MNALAFESRHTLVNQQSQHKNFISQACVINHRKSQLLENLKICSLGFFRYSYEPNEDY